MSSEEADIIDLIQLGNAAPCCIIAESSGSGATFSSKVIDKFKAALYEYHNIEFFPFNKLEAILLVKTAKAIADEEALPLLK